MAVERCVRCDSWIDLDYHCEGFYNDNLEWVCENCMTEKELEAEDG